ncbi:MAG: RluA family pseudouridine synthase [Clostridia bacterium]|nr:RluA family pseudouridine synthase [Clostridia bacterium]
MTENIQLLFEDSQIAVCIKPRGVLSQTDSRGGESMITVLEGLTGSKIYPLHRLDREVSGVMVYAKNQNAAAILSRDIAEHRFKKEYLAIIHGTPESSKGKMHDLLFKDSRTGKVYTVKRMRRGVKEALLEYEVLGSCTVENTCYSAVRVLLHTGRTHQIRVQFASRRMPLAGDRKYGGKDHFEDIKLWSHKISFSHPTEKRELVFTYTPENECFEF